MKNVFFFLGVLFYFTLANAQEMVPFFDEMPVFQEEKKPETADSEKSAVLQPKKATKARKTGKPNLGRDSTPLTSLHLYPVPGIDISLDNSASVLDKKVVVKEVVPEKDILRRDDPLTMTEKDSASDHFQRWIDEKRLRTADGRYVNPLGARYNADTFLISGIGLSMNPSEIEDVLQEQGYIVTNVDKAIPSALSIKYEQDCRLTKKLYIPSEIRECMYEQSRMDENLYVKTMKFERASTRESIIVNFTSLATDNISYRVVYKNKGDASLNTSSKNMAIKSNRKREFWNLVFNVYGLPDDNDELLWGHEDTSFLKAKMIGSAYDAYLLLESTIIQSEDYYKWEDMMNETSHSRTFNFALEDDVYIEQ